MIMSKYLSCPIDKFYNFIRETNNAVLDSDLIMHILLENNVYGVHIIYIDDLKFRFNPDNFSRIGSFKLTYDDELTMNSDETLEVIELEIVANNI